MSTIGYYICVPFAWLVRLFYNLTGSYGVALILFTLVIKLIMLPFQMKSKKSMLRMNRLSGQMKDIQKRYANNQVKMNEEMQKLYAEEGINPMSGCLWTMIPFPILIALYSIIRQPITHFMMLPASAVETLIQTATKAGVNMANIVQFDKAGEAIVKNGFTQLASYGQINLVKAVQEMGLATPDGWFNVNYNFLGLDLTATPWEFIKNFTFTWAVIGVILLSVMCTLVNTGSVDVAGLGLILLKQVLFFVAAAVVVVWVAPALMTLAGVLKAPSGIAVMAVIICLAMAWASNLAGLSYAVGAFFAGIAVSNSDYAEDADRYIEPVGDTLFVPVFFVGIGLQTTGVDDTKMIVFIAIMTVLGVITKVVGCGLGGRMAGFGGASALMIGAGMVPRGEMALITAQIGFNEHVLGSEYYSTIIFIISLVTLVAPLLLKLTIRKVPGVGAAAAGTAGAEQ